MAPSHPLCCAVVSAALEVTPRPELRSGLCFSRSLPQISTEASGAPKFEYPISQISKHPENALAESESTLLSSRGVWEHLDVLRSTGEVAQSVWEDCMLPPD